MRKFGVFEAVLTVLIVAGIAANVFVYGFYNKDGSGDKPDTSGKPAATAESPGINSSPAPTENAPAQSVKERPANTAAPEAREAVVNTLVFRLNSPNVTVNGREAAIDGFGSAPYSHNDTSMLPLRAVYEILGGSIGYDANTQYITATFLDTSMKVKVGETGAEINGAFATLNTAPVSESGTAYVPARAVADALGAELSWDGESQKITLVIPSESVVNVSSPLPAAASAQIPQNSLNDYKGYADGETASIGDFFWYTEDVKWDGLPKGRTSITEFSAISGYWKAYTEDAHVMSDEEFMKWFNAEISGDAGKVKFTYHTKNFTGFDAGNTIDISSWDGENYDGRFSNGQLIVGDVTSMGAEITIKDFYSLNSKQYAVGEINYISGEKEYIALVRP